MTDGIVFANLLTSPANSLLLCFFLLLCARSTADRPLVSAGYRQFIVLRFASATSPLAAMATAARRLARGRFRLFGVTAPPRAAQRRVRDRGSQCELATSAPPTLRARTFSRTHTRTHAHTALRRARSEAGACTSSADVTRRLQRCSSVHPLHLVLAVTVPRRLSGVDPANVCEPRPGRSGGRGREDGRTHTSALSLRQFSFFLSLFDSCEEVEISMRRLP